MSEFERGRTWHHRNGQLENDIFDRDLKIKELESQNRRLRKALELILDILKMSPECDPCLRGNTVHTCEFKIAKEALEGGK